MSDEPQNDGIIDESERGFLEKARAIALYLLRHGTRLVKARKAAGLVRQADAEVDGVLTEFKSLQHGADSNTLKHTVNDSLRGVGQARHIIVDARGTGLTEQEAWRGAARVAGIRREKLDSLRIIGDDFDISQVYS